MAKGGILRFWGADFLASFGDGVRLAAFPLLAAELTHSPAIVAAIVAVQGLPWLLMGLGVGVVLDRCDLRKAMVISGVLQALLLAGLAVSAVIGALNLPLFFVVAFITSVASMVHMAGAQTALPRLVPEDERDRTNGRLQAGELIGSELLGPATTGWLFGISAVLPFAVNAGGSGVAVLLLLSLPSVFRPIPTEIGRERLVKSLVEDVHEGLVWLIRDSTMRALTTAVIVVAMADAAWFAILVLYVVQTLHRGPGDYGLVLAIGALGGVAASAAFGRLTRRMRPNRVLAGAVVVMATTQLVLGLSSDLALACVMIACSSAAFAMYNITVVSLRQRLIPSRLLGRVTSAYLSVAAVAAAFGALIGGVLASSAGIQAPMLAGVLPLVAVALGLMVRGRPSTEGGQILSSWTRF